MVTRFGSVLDGVHAREISSIWRLVLGRSWYFEKLKKLEQDRTLEAIISL